MASCCSSRYGYIGSQIERGEVEFCSFRNPDVVIMSILTDASREARSVKGMKTLIRGCQAVLLEDKRQVVLP